MRAAAASGLPRLVLFHLAAEGDAPDGIAALAPSLGLEDGALAAVSAPVAARAARLFGLPAARVAILPNPAPRPSPVARDVARATLRRAIGLPDDAPLILFVGRLEEAKGADLLPDVSARLRMPLACLGDGPLRGLLQARATGDPRGLLHVLGPVAVPAPWYLAADALLLPSRLEGAPLVFLEAAAHRLPVVTTAGALEALGTDAPRFARIAAPAAADLAAALEEALADTAATVARVEAAAAHAGSLDWERTMDGLVGLLRGATARMGRRPHDPPPRAARRRGGAGAGRACHRAGSRTPCGPDIDPLPCLELRDGVLVSPGGRGASMVAAGRRTPARAARGRIRSRARACCRCCRRTRDHRRAGSDAALLQLLGAAAG
jgi:hypothetical protein